jgi:tetratricopeptide (TPR) repeat protein
MTTDQSDGTADKTTSHSTDELTSHSTRLSKDASQVAGYKQPKDGCQVVGYKPASEQVAGYLQQAIACHQAGQLQEAGACYRAILQTHPNHPEANYSMGVLAVQMKQPAAGLPYFVAALNADPARRQYWLNYIDALLQAGQMEDARQTLALARQHGLQGVEVEAMAVRLEDDAQVAAQDNQQASKESPPVSSAVPQNNKETCKTKSIKSVKSVGKSAQHQGKNPSPQEINTLMALLTEGQFAEAAILAQKMTVRYPLHEFGWMALGAVFKQMGRSADALVPMQKVVALSPGDVEAHYNLGVTLQDIGRLDEAEVSYRQALQINPDYADAHCNLGNILKNLGRLDEAEASYRQALQIKPDLADAHSNLGLTLRDMGRMNEAEESFRRALQINPDIAERHSNLGITLRDVGRVDDAEASLRRALEIKPDLAELHYNLAFTLLLSGRFSEGWHEYEYRWEGSSPKQLRPTTSLPQWIGQTPLPNDRLLIFTEQGMGDKLQFSRYLLLVKNRFANGVSVVVDRPLLALFRRSFRDVDFLDVVPADQSAWQWQCPLLSLPLAFDTTLATIPRHVPYLIPDPTRVNYWKSKIAALDLPASTHKIGVVWKAGKIMKIAYLKGFPLEHLAPLLNQPGCTWFSLQKEPDPDRMPWVSSSKLLDWTDEFSDFDETAALLVNLDLIISVDTSVAHLAGGLGRPTWLLNRHASDWRWMRDREESPWYPTMRIFTQKKAGDWDEVVSRVSAALCKWEFY